MLSQAGERVGIVGTIGMCGEACGKLLQSEVLCKFSLRRWPQFMRPSAEICCPGSWEGGGNDLYLLTAWWQLWSRCITSGTAAYFYPNFGTPPGFDIAIPEVTVHSCGSPHLCHSQGRALCPASTGDERVRVAMISCFSARFLLFPRLP